MAITVLDLLARPDLVRDAHDYFDHVQTKDQKYVPLIEPDDKPALFLNDQIVARMRPKLEKFYYDANRYASYMDQLGIVYPTIGEQKSAQPYDLGQSARASGHADRGRSLRRRRVRLVSCREAPGRSTS
jgi:hypothetical protein